jgi:colanic acid biosynthesis protein WcaH
MSHKTIVTTSFLAGFAAATLFRLIDKRRQSKKNRQNAGAGPEGSDSSLFWGDEKTLTEVPKKNKFLPADVYGKMVQDCVVCCVDCLIVRFNPLTKRKECLLVERGSEPAKGIWWIPGGRLFKGETFFDGAVRKAREETGLDDVEPVQVLGFYNTFFPDSAWDTDTAKGTQTVQPIILVKLQKGAEIKLDATSERYRWIGLDPEEAVSNGEDKYVVNALSKLEAWNSTYGKMED